MSKLTLERDEIQLRNEFKETGEWNTKLINDANKLQLRKLKILYNNMIREDIDEIELTDNFRDIMYDTMWQFINPEVILEFLQKIDPTIRLSYKHDIEDDVFIKPEFKHSICFKGEPGLGHYVYVKDGKPYNYFGSYENTLLVDGDDDGICHGVAMIFALHNCNHEDWKEFSKSEFPIIIGKRYVDKEDNNEVKYRRTMKQNKSNYINILKFYYYLCNDDVDWNQIVDNYFGKDKNLTEINPWYNALNEITKKTLLHYINKLDDVVIRG